MSFTWQGKIIPGIHVTDTIRHTFPGYYPKKSDPDYYAPTPDEFQYLFDKSGIHKFTYSLPDNDCDDFAWMFNGWARQYRYWLKANGEIPREFEKVMWCVGIGWFIRLRHAVNIAICWNGEKYVPYLGEPQNASGSVETVAMRERYEGHPLNPGLIAF